MSYGLHPYAVSLPTLKKTLGARDANLLAALHRKFEKDYADIDDLDDGVASMRQALEDLLLGNKLDIDAGFKYGYALKYLCEHFGKLLTNEAWSSLDWEYIESVDKVLKRAQVDARTFGITSHLAARGSPIPIPRIPDFPSIGYVLEAEIGKVSTECEKVMPKGVDPEITESLKEMRQWFDHCARGHLDLVCFYH